MQWFENKLSKAPRWIRAIVFWGGLPGFIYHELTHILMALLLYPWVGKAEVHRFILSKERMCLNMEFKKAKHWAMLLVSIAPMLGWIAGYYSALYLLPLPWGIVICGYMFFYFVMVDMMGPSKVDLETFVSNYHRLRHPKKHRQVVTAAGEAKELPTEKQEET